MDELKWSHEEKKIARKIYDKAYQNEIAEIKSMLVEKVQKINDDNDIWAVENFLTRRKRSILNKYDYRYSKLISVFAILLSEKYLTEDDLNGLSEEKKERIKKSSMSF